MVAWRSVTNMARSIRVARSQPGMLYSLVFDKNAPLRELVHGSLQAAKPACMLGCAGAGLWGWEVGKLLRCSVPLR